MGTPLKDRNRAEFKRYKEDVEREGKSFFPYAVLHDSIMSLVVVAVIIGLACVWYFTADGTEAGILGPWYTDEADPGTIEFVPRPDWFFYFLFYLLRIFKWPETVVLGTVGVPTILLILLIGLPFYDRRPERRIGRRPVALVAAILTVISMGVLTWKGATAKEALGSELIAAGTVDEWAEEQGFADNAAAVAGATLFAQSGCLNCHTYSGEGNSNLGAPDLTRRRRLRPRRRVLQVVRLEPGAVRQQRDDLVRLSRRREPHEPRDVPRRLQRRRGRAARTASRDHLRARAAARIRSLSVRVFLGITGASGAPYAKGILEGLVGAGAEVGLCASSAGIEVLATELYRDASLPRDEVLARFVGDAGEVGDASTTRRTGSARTRAARRRSTRTSSARARCRPSARSPRAR